jgi:UDP-2,3-diacylglucosamine hydrolase
MSLKELHEGAILVADSHAAPWRTSFIDFLHALESGKVQTTQLILMGDNFDLLFGPIRETRLLNHDAIEILNTLALKMDIIYLEGNHDFQLSSLFSNIMVINRNQQPLKVQFNSKIIALLHGDIRVPIGYTIYTALIRNPFILYCLNTIDTLFGGIIIKSLSLQMQRKNHCVKIENFETIARRLEGEAGVEGCDAVIEGHYHQNRSFHFDQYAYYNLGAFACNERYYVVKSLQNQLILDEALFTKEPV